MKTAIIGTGGVGGYFGGKIAQAGNEVVFIARGEQLKALRQKGLRVKSPLGDFEVPSVHATDDVIEAGNADLIILGVKAWQVSGIAAQLRNHIRKETIILPLQNGILVNDELAAELGTSHAVGGLCRIFAKIESPGVIVHTGVEPSLIFGETDNAITERVLKIEKLLTGSGIKARISEDIQAELWKKFINICASGLLAVTRSTYGEIREMKETRTMMIDLFEEIWNLSQKAGVHVEHEFVAKTVAFIDSFDYTATSSLTRDVWEGKPSEIEYQNGTVVRLGEKYGVPTPINRFIYNCILPMEKKARKFANLPM
ncbi:MAG TPA: 2-dehydropantoate 2-reductase [Bacteroidales bacterium]|nr:2-dehydropantoate 2-reductase [Bacteroidales bacterium]